MRNSADEPLDFFGVYFNPTRELILEEELVCMGVCSDLTVEGFDMDEDLEMR